MTLKQILKDFDTNTETFVLVCPRKGSGKLGLKMQIQPEYFDEVKDGLERGLTITRERYDKLQLNEPQKT